MESETASVVDWLVGSKMCQGGDGLIRYGYGVTISHVYARRYEVLRFGRAS